MKVEFSVDDRAVTATLNHLPDKVRTALLRKLTALSLKLEAHIKQDKLSGQVLNVQTGALRRSIFSTVEQGPDSIIATVGSSSDVHYGAAHEFGATIHIPEIAPVKAQALRFVMGGKEIFAKRVRAHDVKMPERSFMRSSLADMQDEIRDGIKKAVLEALK
jgi:phage gpG-like protein